MIRRLLILSLLLTGCREEPTIVITFEPQDLAPRPPPDFAVRRDLASPPDQRPPPTAAAASGDRCKRDDDCALVKADCCDCSAGGKAIAVAKGRKAGWEKGLAGRCRGVMCVQVLSTDQSCPGRAGCLAGRCAVVPRR